MTLWNSGINLEPLWGHFAALWGHFGVLWFHFEFTLAQVGRSWRQVGPKLAQLGPKFGPKGVHKQIILILPTNFGFQRVQNSLAAAPADPGGGLWDTLAPLWGHFGSL